MPSRNAFHQMICAAADFLEKNYVCKKHHVIHTGSNAYLLDFYSYLGEVEKGKKLIFKLLNLITKNEDGSFVFYPGHMNPMNMSQNVIDTGTAVDTISRFAHTHRSEFSQSEHEVITNSLASVVDSYLSTAARDKKITNQRLWGLTGVVSYAVYSGKEKKYEDICRTSISKAFGDTTPDMFFRYFPDPPSNSLPYDDVTAFYQSRHTAFIQYSVNTLNIERGAFSDGIEKSISALLSMYNSSGIKDMRMECKRWYWLSSYEVASHSFDAFALAHSSHPVARTALHNVLFQIRSHFSDSHLHSHKGVNANFQCPIFWTSHLAWLVRIDDIEDLFNNAEELIPFEFEFVGEEIYSNTNIKRRILINTRFSRRNLTTGIFRNGLKGGKRYVGGVPNIPYAYLFSLREVLNHSWYALRGFHLFEFCSRLVIFVWNSLFMLMPLYKTEFGKIESYVVQDSVLTVSVRPGSKYGTLLPRTDRISISL